MNQILCSTGALLGRPNNRDYRLLKAFAPKLNCDGFELMVYGSWYPEIDDLISTIKAMKLNIPVVHAQKAIGETLSGIKVSYENGSFNLYEYTESEDKERFAKGVEDFKLNLRVARELGASKMVLHLWNGTESDKRLDRNIERFGLLKDLAEQEDICLMVENVICNTFDPIRNIKSVYSSYPDVNLVYDTKMAEFHTQTMKLFEPEYEMLVRDGHIKHLHVNDYSGGYMDWGNMNVLPIGMGHVDFDAFFEHFFRYEYAGDYTMEATGFNKNGVVDIDMLNANFDSLRKLISKYGKISG